MFYQGEGSSDLQLKLMEEMVQRQSMNLRHHLENPHIPDTFCKQENFVIMLFFHNIKAVSSSYYVSIFLYHMHAPV